MRRLRQIVANIKWRNYQKERSQQLLTSWQTRTLATFIAGGYMTDGKDNRGLTAAAKVSIDSIERAQFDESEVTPPVQQIESNAAVGSYERLLGAITGHH